MTEKDLEIETLRRENKRLQKLLDDRNKDNITVGYSTHKKMIDERDEMIKLLEKALDKSCKLLYQWQISRTTYFCPKPLYTPLEWKDYFLKEVSENGSTE